MPSIAIVGTEACGKTVFITTLAMKMGVMNTSGVFLKPKDPKTLEYVQRNWRTLNNREWPPFTRQGELFDLQWVFMAGGGVEFNVRLVDAAGHDLRQLFASGVADEGQTPDALKPLARYCSASDIVLFMVNLKDFVGEGDELRRDDNQNALLWAMDHLKKAGKRCCMIFTQADQYADYVKENGGWDAIARTRLNWIYGAHLADGSVPMLTVAAVKDTEVVIDNGSPRRVPVPKFASDGLEEVVTWVTTRVKENLARESAIAVAATAQKRAEEEARIRSETLAAKERRNAEIKKTNRRVGGCLAGIVGAIVLVWAASGIKGLVDEANAKQQETDRVKAAEEIKQRYPGAIRTALADDEGTNEQIFTSEDGTVRFKSGKEMTPAKHFRETVSKMKQVDLSGCPGDYQSAYKKHIRAWQVEAELIESLQLGYSPIEAWNKYYTEHSNGKFDSTTKMIGDTYHDVLDVARSYDVDVKKYEK